MSHNLMQDKAYDKGTKVVASVFTEENMELERRMAAVLAEDEDDDSVTNASTPQESATIADLTHATSDTDFRHTMANIDLENTANTDLEGANAITNESYEI